jgi:hypothetical protein
VRAIHRRQYLAAVVVAGAAVAAFVMVGGIGAGAAPGNGKATGNGKALQAAAHAALGGGSVGGGKSSGDTTSPQPPSKADFSGHGANVHGPYDSTRDGSPSGNGNGNGNAIGKPCAGCVGKADNKNPPGQMPNGTDPNAGYECDRNHGIGRTNPAHTGCTSSSSTSTPPPPPCENNCSSTPPPPCENNCSSTPPPPCENNCGGGTSSETPSAPASFSTPAAPAAASAQAPINATPANNASGLANTGAINAGLFAGIAGGLVVLGVAALSLSGWLTRRRTE